MRSISLNEMETETLERLTWEMHYQIENFPNHHFPSVHFPFIKKKKIHATERCKTVLKTEVLLIHKTSTAYCGTTCLHALGMCLKLRAGPHLRSWGATIQLLVRLKNTTVPAVRVVFRLRKHFHWELGFDTALPWLNSFQMAANKLKPKRTNIGQRKCPSFTLLSPLLKDMLHPLDFDEQKIHFWFSGAKMNGKCMSLDWATGPVLLFHPYLPSQCYFLSTLQYHSGSVRVR